MNAFVVFIEVAALPAGFTLSVFGMLLISPLTFISDYPPEIQAEYYRSQHKEAAKGKLTKLMVRTPTGRTSPHQAGILTWRMWSFPTTSAGSSTA